MNLTDQQLKRLAAALWDRVDQPTTYHDLAWADDLLGIDGRDQLWAALTAEEVLQGNQLQAKPLARFLSRYGTQEDTRLLWTLPKGLDAPGTRYAEGLTQVIQSAREELLLMSPFIQAEGVQAMQRDIQNALHRGVIVTLIGHDLQDIGSPQSRAVNDLRLQAERLSATFIAYAANHQGGLLHAKLAVADQERVILGSANMTGHGLGINFEVGVILGPLYARQVANTYRDLLKTPLVRHVFTTVVERRMP